MNVNIFCVRKIDLGSSLNCHRGCYERNIGWGEKFYTIGMEEAYDHVALSFLFYIMNRMSFGDKWGMQMVGLWKRICMEKGGFRSALDGEWGRMIELDFGGTSR